MALVFLGKSNCPLCGDVLQEGEELTMFPAFINNEMDALHVFNDNGFHVTCCKDHPLGELAVIHRMQTDDMLAKLRAMTTSYQDAENLLMFGLLTSNEDERLFQFNYLLFPKEEIRSWNRLEEFLHEAQKFIKDGKWQSSTEFNYLEHLISKIEEACIHNR